jgi:hypothetical protein
VAENPPEEVEDSRLKLPKTSVFFLKVLVATGADAAI